MPCAIALKTCEIKICILKKSHSLPKKMEADRSKMNHPKIPNAVTELEPEFSLLSPPPATPICPWALLAEEDHLIGWTWPFKGYDSIIYYPNQDTWEWKGRFWSLHGDNRRNLRLSYSNWDAWHLEPHLYILQCTVLISTFGRINYVSFCALAALSNPQRRSVRVK